MSKKPRSTYLTQWRKKCVHNNVTNIHWKKLKHWANWWTSTRHLQMFTKAFTIQEPEKWDGLSKTTNPVESINRQTFKSKNNLHVILENMFMEDRLHAAKMIARSQHVNIDYASTNTKKTKTEKENDPVC